MLALLSLTSLKEWFWAGLVVVMGLLALHIYHAGEAHEIAALKVQSAKLVAQAAAQVAATQNVYETQLTKEKSAYENNLQVANAQLASDAQRLRDYDAYRRAHPDVGSAGQPPANAGAGSPSGSDSILERLEQVAVRLAAATRDTANALSACVAERSTLTGK